MEAVFGVSFPVFSIVLLAYFARKLNWVEGGHDKALNTYVYYFALPPLLFLGVAQASPQEILNWHFIAANLVAAIACFILSVAICYWIFDVPLNALPVRGMVASYGTTGYMGVPLILAAYGKSMMLPAALGTLLHNIPIIVLVILLFEWIYRGTKKGSHVFLDIMTSIFLNPLVIAVILGVLFAFLHIVIPKPFLTVGNMLADSAGPCALFALGLSLAQPVLASNQKPIRNTEVAAIVLLKLIVQPLLTGLLIFYFWPMQADWVRVSLILSALPAGVTSYVFAQKYASDVAGTSKIIFISMIGSMFTLSTIIALKQLL